EFEKPTHRLSGHDPTGALRSFSPGPRVRRNYVSPRGSRNHRGPGRPVDRRLLDRRGRVRHGARPERRSLPGCLDLFVNAAELFGIQPDATAFGTLLNLDLLQI